MADVDTKYYSSNKTEQNYTSFAFPFFSDADGPAIVPNAERTNPLVMHLGFTCTIVSKSESEREESRILTS